MKFIIALAFFALISVAVAQYAYGRGVGLVGNGYGNRIAAGYGRGINSYGAGLNGAYNTGIGYGRGIGTGGSTYGAGATLGSVGFGRSLSGGYGKLKAV